MMMQQKTLVIDVETTTFQKGNPFSRRNRLCIVAGDFGIIPFDYKQPCSSEAIEKVQQHVHEAETVVLFNAKFDLHWLRRYGIVLRPDQRIWDCQTAHFVISNQTSRLPSLNEAAAFFGLGQKFDIIEQEYWSKGIDTPAIPEEILYPYALQDIALTRQVYEKQLEYLADKPEKLRLIKLCNLDTIVLEEMEWNGLRYDSTESLRRAEQLKQEMDGIDANIKNIVGNYNFNFNSPDHVSAILYGGTIKFVVSTPYDYTFKGGARAGQTTVRYKHAVTEVKFPRLVEPVKDSKLKKDGLWSTNGDNLKQLKARGKPKQVISLLLKRAELEQLRSTYYEGWPKKMAEMDWPEGEVHSQLHQSVAVTGRLSSSAPNQQNVPPEVAELVKTRYNQ